MPTTLADLCRSLFLIGHLHVRSGQAGDGAAFEKRARQFLDDIGLPDARGFRVLGRRSCSGLYHQLDEQTRSDDALVVAEWKAYRGRIPKNDLLRFKAATDDYWFGTRPGWRAPIVRVFGGTGTVSEEMRAYAAQWGIIMITPDRWPVPVLCDRSLAWRAGGLAPVSAVDYRSLASLVRPMAAVLKPLCDGSWLIPAMPSACDLSYRLRVWAHHSERAWEWWRPGRPSHFDALVDSVAQGLAA
jgi:hypothetical protein